MRPSRGGARRGKSPTQRHREDETGDDGVTPWRTEGSPKKRRREPPEWWRTWRWVVLAVLLLLNIWVVNVLLAPRITASQSPTTSSSTSSRPGISPTCSRVATRSMWSFKRPVRVADSATPVTEFDTTRPSFANDDLVGQLLDRGVKVNAAPGGPQRSLLLSLVLSVLPVLIFVGLYFLLFRSLFARTGPTLGRSRARLYDPDTAPRVTFDDVAGIEEVKDELRGSSTCCATHGGIAVSAPPSPAACCWRDRARERRSSLAQWPARRMRPSSRRLPRVHRDGRRRRRQPRPRPLQRGAQGRSGDRLHR